MGINQYGTKTLASKPELLKSYFPNLLTTKLILNIIYPVLIVATGYFIMRYDRIELYYLGLVCIMHGGNQLLQFFRANFQAMQAFRIDGFASVADKAILLVVVVAMLYTGITVETYLFARIAVTVVAAIGFYIVLSKQYGWLRPRFEAKLIRTIMKGSFSFALITVLYSVHDKIDQVMLKELYGEVETGLYAAAYRWMDAFGMYIWMVLGIFFAKFAYHIDETMRLNHLLKFGQIVSSVPIIYVCIFVFFYGEKLLWQQHNSSPEEMMVMGEVIRILFVAMLANAYFMVYSTLLSSTGHEKAVNLMVLLAIVINVVLNYIFIPHYGAIAAAWATVASLGMNGILYIGYTQFRIQERVPYSLLLRIILVSGLLYGVFYALESWGGNWYINSGIALVIYVGLCFGLGIVRRDLILDQLEEK